MLRLYYATFVFLQDPNAVNLRSFYGAMLYFRPNLSKSSFCFYILLIKIIYRNQFIIERLQDFKSLP